jgi:transposase InsO family protein
LGGGRYSKRCQKLAHGKRRDPETATTWQLIDNTRLWRVHGLTASHQTLHSGCGHQRQLQRQGKPSWGQEDRSLATASPTSLVFHALTLLTLPRPAANQSIATTGAANQMRCCHSAVTSRETRHGAISKSAGVLGDSQGCVLVLVEHGLPGLGEQPVSC